MYCLRGHSFFTQFNFVTNNVIYLKIVDGFTIYCTDSFTIDKGLKVLTDRSICCSYYSNLKGYKTILNSKKGFGV